MVESYPTHLWHYGRNFRIMYKKYLSFFILTTKIMKYDFDRQLYFYGPRIMEVVKGQKISKEIVFYIYIQQSLEI